MQKNPYTILIGAAIDAGVYAAGAVKGKTVLLIGGFLSAYMDETKVPAMLLQEYLLAEGMQNCCCLQSFYQNGPACAGNIEQELPGRQFDIVVLFEGMETVRSFSQAAFALDRCCAPGGSILLMARKPECPAPFYVLRELEDVWRYTCQDLGKLFTGYTIEKELEMTPGYLAAVMLRKPLGEVSLPSVSPLKLYNCRAGQRVDEAAGRQLGFFHTYQLLDDIGLYEVTDKSSMDHNYLDKYEFFLRGMKDEPFTLLELGVFEGGSERMWKAYFPKAQIVGVDINPECQKFAEERIEIRIRDLSQLTVLEELKALRPRIVVDDASHICSHQILALFTLFSALPSGGLYILEDMETSLNQRLYPSFVDTEIDAYEVCSRIAHVAAAKSPCTEGPWADAITTIGMQTELVATMKGSCIFIKR